MAKPLTPRQQAILDFLRAEQARCGCPPTLREIGERFGLRSTGSVRDHLHALERKGHLTRHPHRARGIRLRPAPSAAWARSPRAAASGGIPLLGEIAAGAPRLAEEAPEDALPVDPALFGGGELFALRVEGESMVDAGILPGDTAIVRSQASVEDGEIVAALLEDEATVKRFFRQGRRVRLQPANEAFEPILLSARDAELRILGKVVGVLRRL